VKAVDSVVAKLVEELLVCFFCLGKIMVEERKFSSQTSVVGRVRKRNIVLVGIARIRPQ